MIGIPGELRGVIEPVISVCFALRWQIAGSSFRAVIVLYSFPIVGRGFVGHWLGTAPISDVSVLRLGMITSSRSLFSFPPIQVVGSKPKNTCQ